ncbi:Similar to predicted protein [Chaetomium globosum CBS 148.51]; acc. no. XP_001226427 [Pyronema omphalodes CBS 100304]|uniref:Uncharacterized protein n=1 Tax=Pyronema omphalodes (strain CBS 100304) TaxID=1076935 RepID=U4LAZ0_PYROM|nr:Similar to predicted protein [Chaetomium globosum CBS 148.51]; acc. no. XP_001226427 [Pyronema omphalodes CBS 100304]
MKYNRTISQDTVPSIASSTSPKEYLSTLGKQFHKAFTYKEGACANLSLDRIIRADSQQYDEETFRRADSGLNDTRACWILDGKPCIELCREELAALALALGMKLRVNDFTGIVSGFGAFSTSLGIQRSGGYWKASLVHGSRIPSQRNSQGSGYTILMAKHIACGCIPFTDTGVWIRTIYVTQNVLRAITRGYHVMDCSDYGGPSLEYLRRLPSAQQIDALYGMSKKPADLKAAKKYQRERYLKKIEKEFDGAAGTSSPDLPNTPRNSTTVRPVAQATFLALGALLNADGNPIGNNCTWQRAVTGIAFGGLVPQAATCLAEAVRFTVAGKLGCCITALESLINKLHRFDKDSEVFGSYVARRVAARYGIDNVDYSTPSRITTQEAGATFGRYMNLLECITARCNSAPNPPMETVYEASCELVEDCYLSAVTKDGDRYNDDLGMQVQSITQQLEKHAPMKPDDCAIIVRCILAAWSAQVPLVDLEERRTSTEPECQANRLATLEDLPAVCALG